MAVASRDRHLDTRIHRRTWGLTCILQEWGSLVQMSLGPHFLVVVILQLDTQALEGRPWEEELLG